MGINSVTWGREKIMAIKKFVQGSREAEFYGRRKNGEKYKTPMRVETLLRKHPSWKFSVKGGHLFVDDGGDHGARQVLSPEATERLVKGLYKNKAIAVGKAPSIYNYMKTKYVGFGYARVEKLMKSIPEYQKYQARHLKKKKSRTTIISRAPGAEIDADLMFFSTKYYSPGMNNNHQGLIVVVDRFSGYIAVSPISFGEKNKSADVVTKKTEAMLRSDSFPKAQGRTIFHDNGVEFRNVFPHRMAQIGYNDVVISQAAGAPSPHAERAVGIIRKLINQKLSANDAPEKHADRWWPMARQLVSSYNDTPMTDARAPHTPNQLKRLRGQRAAAMVRAMQKSGFKRLALGKHSKKSKTGATVQKGQQVLAVGDRVRAAIEHLSKDSSMKRPFPTQRWSSTVYRVAKVLQRKVGYARYQLSRLPRQRFEREDLQYVGGQKSGPEEAPAGNLHIEKAVAKRAAKRTARHG
jgi:hypothetical protein